MLRENTHKLERISSLLILVAYRESVIKRKQINLVYFWGVDHNCKYLNLLKYAFKKITLKK